MSTKRVLSYLRIAKKLEEEAIERYTDHIKKIENPEINALLEGIRRNEERHLRMLKQYVQAISTEEEL
jgi:rubrerythrin